MDAPMINFVSGYHRKSLGMYGERMDYTDITPHEKTVDNVVTPNDL
jgi:hypothetical protein